MVCIQPTMAIVIVTEFCMMEDVSDVRSYVDLRKMRKNLDLPKGSRIKYVLVHNWGSPLFRNVLNEQVPYKNPVCCLEKQAGAYKRMLGGHQFTFSDYPAGDAIVVVTKK